jgi:excinuclease ABC subunit A
MNSNYLGIETNNLKGINVSIPHGEIILIAGVSGSGKSSLAIDTIHNISMNELNQLMNLKDFVFNYSVAQYENILPSVSLEQENYNRNPRSTIATYFGLDTYVKNLFSIKSGLPASVFQFNCYKYACKKCLGLGVDIQLDPAKIIDYNSTLRDIPFLNWRGSYSNYYKQLIFSFCNDNGIDVKTHFIDLNKDLQNLFLYGKGDKKYKIVYKTGGRKRVKSSSYIGPLNTASIFNASSKKYYSEQRCPDCNGYRFSKEILKYKVYGKNIGEIYNAEIDNHIDWIMDEKKNWKEHQNEAVLFKRILSLLNNFINLNLRYLYLNRAIPSLSGGELQRLRLAKSLSSQFSNFFYILDEPSSGLHPDEISKITDTILLLKKKNNTVIIIEHNPIFKSISDKIILLGPSGGKNGGKIISNKLSERNNKPFLYKFFPLSNQLLIKNESYNNIINFSAKIPMGSFVSICGKSGSGKTSFLAGILPKYLKKSIYLNQTPLRGNNYSILASYIGILDEIREAFAKNSKQSPSFFSFYHTGEGKCKNCNGTGMIQNEDAYNTVSNIICPSCDGMRYNSKALRYLLNGINIYQFLNLTVQELINFLDNGKLLSKTLKSLHLLNKIGLGYITLFRNITTLSGGEAQRVKMCNSLLKNNKNTAILLDEPLRGVDDFNAREIINLIYDIVAQGNSVFVVEHNLIAINSSSYIIEFGPEGGKYGGEILYNGQKSEIKSSNKSLIKKYIDKNS